MFRKINIGSGYIYCVEKDDSLKENAKWGMTTALNKASYTIDTWQKRPNKFSKFVDIYYGDYAKNIVKSFLLFFCKNLDITEYDLIRTDDFKEHDLFDLKHSGKEIEIKSSLEKYTNSIVKIYNKRRIIININSPHETVSDFVVQVFFVPDDLTHHQKIEYFNKTNPTLTEAEVIAKCHDEVLYSLQKTSIFIVGWISKDQEEKVINEAKNHYGFGVKNASTNANYRTYGNLLIKDSNNMDELIDTLTNNSINGH